MLRQINLKLNNIIPLRGAPPKVKARMPSYQVIHQSQRPAYPFKIDFSKLDLKYPIIYTPKSIGKFGTSPKPDIQTDYPFFIERTLTGSVPVYTDFLGGRTKVITLLRRCGGDIDALKEEMSKVCDNKEVRIRIGRLEVDGNYCQRLKRWIIGLGL